MRLVCELEIAAGDEVDRHTGWLGEMGLAHPHPQNIHSQGEAFPAGCDVGPRPFMETSESVGKILGKRGGFWPCRGGSVLFGALAFRPCIIG